MGSVQAHVYPKDIYNIPYIVIPDNLIEKFGNIISSLNNKISVNQYQKE